MLNNQNVRRRTFLKGSFAAGTTTIAISAGLLTPTMVLGEWPTPGFDAKKVDQALLKILNSDITESSDKIKIKAPKIAENGAVVPITVSTSITDVKSITILASGNTSPLSAHFLLASNTVPEVSTRIKMAQTSDVVCVVKANGKLYSAKKSVKVTIGGCGG